MRAQIRNTIKRTLGQFQPINDAQPATLGTPTGTVAVPGKANYVYAQIAGSIIEVFNVKVPSVPGLPVFVGHDPLQPRRLQVLSQFNGVFIDTTGQGAPTVAPHHSSHEYPTGGDIVYSELRQILPFRVSAAGGLYISVYRGIAYGDSAYYVVQPTTTDGTFAPAVTTVNLTSLVPSTADKAIFVLITLNGTATVVATAGAEVDLDDLVLTDIPATPAGTKYVLAAVRLYEGQTEIVESISYSDIVDLRFPMRDLHSTGSGDVTGPGSSTDGHLAVFNGTTGKVLKDGGAPGGGGDVTGPGSSTDGHAALFNGTTGKIIKDGGVPVSGPGSSTNGHIVTWNGTTGLVLADGGALPSGDVAGPASATDGHLAVFNGTSGKILKDGGTVPAGTVTGPGSATDGHLAVFNGTSGIVLKDGGAVPAGGGDVTGPGSSTNNNFAVFNGTTGKILKDGGVPISGPGSSTNGHLVTWNGTTGLVLADGGVVPSGDVAGPASATNEHLAVFNGTTGKVIKDGGAIPTGTVTGPGSSTNGHLATWNGTTGLVLADGGTIPTGTVTGPAGATDGHLAVFDGTSGIVLKDGGAVPAGGGDVTGPGSSTDSHVALFNGTTGKIIKDGGVLPSGNVAGPAGATDSHLAVFDGTSGKVLKDGGAVPAGGGDVTGPGSSTDGHLAVFNGTTGKVIKDGGAVPAGGGDVTGPGSSTDNHVATFNGTTGKIIKDGGVLPTGDVAGPGSSTDNHVALFNGTTGKIIKDGGVLPGGTVTGPGSSVDGHLAVFNGTTGVVLKDGGVAATGNVAGAASSVDGDFALFDGTGGKTIKDGGNRKLNNLLDTLIVAPSANQFLTYNASDVTLTGSDLSAITGSSSCGTSVNWQHCIRNDGTAWQGCGQNVTGIGYIDLQKPMTIKSISLAMLHQQAYVSGPTKSWTIYGSTTNAWAGEEVNVGSGSCGEGVTGTYVNTLTNATYRYFRINMGSAGPYRAIYVDYLVFIMPSPGWENTTVRLGNHFNGDIQNGYFTATVASNNLTIALKTLAGNNPSTTDPIEIRIGNTVRVLTAALSVTANAATNWCNAGGAELATKEVDYFVYVGYNSTDGVVIGFSRIPFGLVYSDFSATSTNEKFCKISTIAHAAAGDCYENIGRFAATLSAGAGYTWSVPTYTNANLVQGRIMQSRWLDWVPTYSASESMTYTSISTTRAKYQVVGNIVFFDLYATGTTGVSASNNLNATPPFTPALEVVGATRVYTPTLVNWQVGTFVVTTAPLIQIARGDNTQNYALEADARMDVTHYFPI